MVQVTISEGILEGVVVENEFGGTFCSFKGIPYAAPPIEDLRFKAPRPPKPWDGIRSAKEHGPVCFQKNPFNPLTFIGSEDCLYLNVYTPSIKPGASLPVMVWIHGGAFVSGSGNDDLAGPEFLIKHNVVIVTVNYRLEMLGFLCLDTEEIPGNAGMKDQVAALRWVQKNIKYFGGDPRNVTIFGVIAGGASVGFHLISPMSKGLFKRAIAQSGCSGNSWSRGFALRERALLFAKQQGFLSEGDKELYEFFKNQPVSNLVGVNLPVTKDEPIYGIMFGVADEKMFGDNERFFYGDALTALNNGIHEGVEVMTGYTKDEGLAAFILTSVEKLIEEVNTYIEFFVPRELKMETSIRDQLKIGRMMRERYLKRNVILNRENMDSVLNFLNMEMFVYGIIIFAKLISKKNTVYLYKFSCISERNIITSVLGLQSIIKSDAVCHDDASYLFPAKVLNIPYDKDSESAIMIDKITTMWTNFAKFGNPTPDNNVLGVKWKPFTVRNQDYLEIGNVLKPSTHPDGDDVDFWDDTFKQYLPRWSVFKNHNQPLSGALVSRCRITRN